VSGDPRVTWGDPNPRRGDGGTAATFCTVAAHDLDELETVLGTLSESLGEVDEPTVDGPLELEDAPPELVADRYERRSPLGSGGMGEVWRVHDRLLRRTVALKVIRSKLVGERMLVRFREEAQVSAQLQHPGIIPVHDYGQLDDGRVWFTMKEVRGRTLEELLTEVHRAWRLGRDVSDSGFSFRRLLESFLRVVETMAYSHSRGVVHRDIKPSNIMLGGYGEVLVLDWGLAKVMGGIDLELPTVDLDADSGNLATRVGAITGTPAYMSPEQARGDSAEAGPAADVYALGATLYDLLCERPPRLASSPRKLVMQVAVGKSFPPPRQVAEGPPVDEELERICLKALQTEVVDRYPDAAAMAAELAQWLDDARKREQAMAFVEQSQRRMRDAEEAEARSGQRAKQAAEALEGVAENAPVADKLAGWGLEDEAAQLQEASRSARTEGVQLLRSALSHFPDLVEAHDALADHLHRTHARLEAGGREAEARQVAADLRLHDRSERYAAYLKGTGALTLITDPPGAEVRLHRYVLNERRLQPVFERVMGTTPLVEAPLEMGSYLITLHREGHEEVRYPVFVQRQEHWHGVPPGGTEPFPIRLPRKGELAPDDRYVPAGWCLVGDPAEGLQRVWVDGMLVKRHPVTVEQYIGFLNDLVEAGREEEALASQPRIADSSEPFFERAADGGLFTGIRLEDDADDLWRQRSREKGLPVVLTDRPSARAYCRHLGPGWRLPAHVDYQKAGRGVDGRAYPWGDYFDPTWCRMRDTAPEILFVPVGSYPNDCSPYGCSDILANVAECADDGHVGGSCGNSRAACALWRVMRSSDTLRLGYLGFRPYRSLS